MQAATLDRYRLIRRLGRGGMGEVYLARDEVLGREVAIKFLTAAPDDRAWKRLLNEARSAAALDHPNICTVHEVGETADGRGFIVMQYVEGETLAARLERGPLSVRDALALCAQVTDALAVAHRHGIVHRDLKPQNVILARTGRPTLVDFGLAKALPLVTASEQSTHSAETVSGALAGTPGYMSPEQVQQHPIDGRSDLFALGAVMFECLTGRRAFHGESPLDTVGQILHRDPPPASSLRAGLDDRHDALCRRLLAKDAGERFQSAEEVLGALRLLAGDTPHGASSSSPSPSGSSAGLASAPPAGLVDPRADTAIGDTQAVGHERPRWGRRSWTAAAVVVAVLLAVAGWRWAAMRPSPPAPDDAARWYERGTEAVREGAYRSGQLALEEAVRLYPQYALAHARLAEAFSELDDERAAQEQLLRLASLVPDQSRLPEDERLRVAGIRALVLRDLDTSTAAYRRLTERRPDDATAWFDLGRVQESAGAQQDALAAYTRALQIDPQLAAAHLRLGTIYANESRNKEALAAFAEAERLYRSATNTEGEAEVLLRRGGLHDGLNDLAAARADLERTLSLATTLQSTHQVVRAQLALSSVTASEGRVSAAEALASTAVEAALAKGLDTVASAGLVDLAATLQLAHVPEAAAQAERALQLAERRGARRTAARARLQLAAIRNEQQRPREAVVLAEQALTFLRPNRYRRFELYGLSILSRAYEQLDDLDRARDASAEVLASAEALGNEAQVGLALSNLASLASALGRLPEALALRERAEGIRRAQGDNASLPYDLANRADLLIRLGRGDEARVPLAELDVGIRSGVDTYVGRVPRVLLLRGMAAVVARRHDEAVAALAQLKPFRPDGTSVGALAPVLYDYALARASGGRAKASPLPGDTSIEPALARERQYWLAAAALARRDARAAHDHATRGLGMLGALSNDELRWRLSAVGVLAARQLRDTSQEADLMARMNRALGALRDGWPGGIGDYEARPDLAELRTRVGS